MILYQQRLQKRLDTLEQILIVMKNVERMVFVPRLTFAVSISVIL